ncbi:molybdenum cofactor biosynthesis protein MoaE [Cellulomonas hominis]|uniref:molybdenum cofactor biosynthesis protein MoaE n=1 Tax=Cellulomonas hominis TaxID=156981 RepID=UPI001C110B69|nr:molybdenum cofactor biosynthesis protein MoaE [Cellulomonas hominis]MBU5422359.1 molybdenum cofactor biosynthesis protein MoaE [Cellulomonas hominis]
MAAPCPDATAAHPALDGAPAPARDSSRVAPAARTVVRAEVTRDAIDPADLAREVGRATAGAVVTFSGVVRDHDLGRAVTGIEYVAHPSAPDVMAAVVADVAARSDVDAVAAVHRIGDLGIGDCALAVAVAAAHRAEAFEAASALVDEVKHRLPVWKRQEFPDGTDEWVACP